ncbi:MAG: (5-formylfuran-3-yl)methyl phosphate synthase [Gemmatimonadales bacterium]
MRLLVSVRSAAEAVAAVTGGADIVDAKEPTLGSLGPVEPAVLRAIAEALPGGVPLSVALGDLHDPAAARGALAPLDEATFRPAGRPAMLYVKVGLAGVHDPALARAVVGAVVEASGLAPLRPAVVAVAYADHERAGALSRDVVAHLAADAGADGVLLDTWGKDGRDLFAWAAPADIQRWLDTARRLGLLTALAGSLSADGVRAAGLLGPHVVGVRGAACEGGRSGLVSPARVRQLAAIAGGSSPADAVA